MDYLIELLSPEQFAAITAAYGSVAAWVSTLGDSLTAAVNAILQDDVML